MSCQGFVAKDSVVAICQVGLALGLRAERHRQALSQLLVDEIGGLQNGYTGKIEAEALNPGRGKGLGKVTIPLLMGALGVELAIVPAMRPSRTHRDKNSPRENYFSRKTRKATEARWADVTPKQRKKAMRALAKARWAKVKAERERTT